MKSKKRRVPKKNAGMYGYTIVEGQDVEPSQFKIKNLEYISALQKGESGINGETLRQRAVALRANFGLADGMRILKHQDEIPKKMREHIVLAGTLLRDADGQLVVAILYWDYFGIWRMSFLPLSNTWTRHCLPRIKGAH